MTFLHMQTVWEAENVNTPERGPREVRKYKIEAPVGYDGHVDGERTSIMMHSYSTGGTPWTIVIDKKGIVRFSEVTPKDPVTLSALIEELRAEE